ncbi:MAG TPA: orotate phosphoribosyltransferase [Phycisphaerae bacterium]|nr:orotate phosphoribosyltransferase [Phycisphaerae bacterium]
MTDAELADALRRAALLEGEFTLRSGRKSRYYLDKYLFETDPTLLRALAQRFARFVTPDVQRLAGPELGGVALAAAVALETGRPFVIVRNSKKADYGTGKLIEGRFNPGERVLVLEDIATSGGQALEAVRTLGAHRLETAVVVAVIDRLEGARENLASAKVRFEALFTTRDLGILPA